jgi:hypothetical protein
MVGHLLIEGGSTAQGYGDEERKGGYAGRLLYHYIDYNTAKLSQKRASLPYIYAHTNGLVDNIVRTYVHTLPNSIRKARQFDGLGRHEVKLVGVFAVGGSLDSFAREQGTESILNEWRLALNGIKKICQEQDVHSIYIGMPLQDENSRLSSIIPDLTLRDRQAEITEQLLPDLIPFEMMAGTDSVLEEGPLHYGIHPNAKGYGSVADYLIPLIDRGFGMNSRALT